jgi:hypothetical protein
MSSLRILGFSYLATASLFGLAIACADQTALYMVTDRATEALSREFRARIVTPVLAFARAEDEKFLDRPTPPVVLPLAPPGSNDARDLAHVDLPPVPARKVAPRIFVSPEPILIAPDLPADFGADAAMPDAPPALPSMTQPRMPNAPMPDLPGSTVLSPAQRAAVTEGLTQNLTPEMLTHFDLFLYISKARKGPLAQRLYVFRKNAKGDLELAHDWAASTGREAYETTPRGVRTRTNTPAGFYELDPSRMYRKYRSHAWGQSMPYAMFFNWEHGGYQTGLAIHAATGDDVALLGQRASAGCIHLSPQHAQQLYEMIHAHYKGKVPRFAYDRRTGTMSNKGEMMRDKDSNLVLTDGYKVLVDIEDFGNRNEIAALY